MIEIYNFKYNLKNTYMKLMTLRNSVIGGITTAALLTAGIAFATTSIRLNVATAPGTTAPGNNVTVTGAPFPSGAILPADVTVSVSTTCGDAPVATTPATAVTTILGSTRKVKFTVPASLTAGTYAVSIAGISVGGEDFTSSNCSAMSVI